MPNVCSLDDDSVVGFKKEAEIIVDQLIRGPRERDVVLITGMGGLGKTTLAKRVYDMEVVVKRFDIRAWCTISQEYDCKDLLRKIYNQVCDIKIQDDNIAEKLRQSLIGKRYLIPLDDIWSLEIWEELNRVFPYGEDGSRIILTSRQENVVSDAKCICLPFFTIDESWELLQLKLFKGDKCPEELENIGRKISKKCGGLPLTVGLVASLLKRVEKNEQKWHEFLNSLNTYSTFGESIQSNEVIELSYKHLPNHLKPCLLYFAAFPEDKEIEVSYLIKLWIAEGFVEIIDKEIIEDEAEDYLNHLVGSNLVMVSERKYNGCILECAIHDLESVSTIEAVSNSEMLQTFVSTLPLSIRDEHLLRKLPHLKNLNCCVSLAIQFAEIEFLHHLKCLELYSIEGHPHADGLKLSKFPSSVKELKLSSFTLSSSAIAIIAQLPNLEDLKLQSCKFEGSEWNVEEETQFRKLKYLNLLFVDLVKWNANTDSFPCLEQLNLRFCKKLMEVPSSFVDISTLQAIIVFCGNQFIVRSVEKILEEARDMGKDHLKVRIDDLFSRKKKIMLGKKWKNRRGRFEKIFEPTH